MLVAVGVLALGAGLGGGGSLLLEERGTPVDGSDRASTDPGVLTPDPGPITIAFVGDVTADGALLDRLAADPAGFVGPMAGTLRDADLVVANLDAPISSAPDPDAGAAPPGVLVALASAGVDVVSLANDRSLALGPAGPEEALASGAVALVGLGSDEAAAYRPFVREVGGHTVALVAATQVLEPERIATDTAGPGQPGVASAKRVDRLVAEAQSARAAADTVVVYVHWGTTGETCPTPSQQELAVALVAAGADVVAGPGAGRLQGAGRSGRAAVAYGLGGFLADSTDGPESGVLLVQIDGREVLDIGWVPARRVDGVPEPLAGADADAAVAGWDALRDCTDLTP